METGRRNIQFDMSQQQQLFKHISRAAEGRSISPCLFINQAIKLVSQDTKLPSEGLIVHKSYKKTTSSKLSKIAYVNKSVPAV